MVEQRILFWRSRSKGQSMLMWMLANSAQVPHLRVTFVIRFSSDSSRLLSAYRRTVSRTWWPCPRFDHVSTTSVLRVHSKTITTACESTEYTSAGGWTQCLTCHQCVTDFVWPEKIKTKHNFWTTTMIWHIESMWQNNTFILKRKELIRHTLGEKLIEYDQSLAEMVTCKLTRKIPQLGKEARRMSTGKS